MTRNFCISRFFAIPSIFSLCLDFGVGTRGNPSARSLSLCLSPSRTLLAPEGGMASQNAVQASPPSAHVVGNLFVEQYYPILHHKPEEVHKFYKDSSVLSRPDATGIMTSVTSMQAIDELVMSLDYKNSKVEIETVDAQHSYKEGVIVLVTGCLTGKDSLKQRFTQTFFLAPQETGGYFVLNDVVRYVSESQYKETEHKFIMDTKSTSPKAYLNAETETAAVHDVPEKVSSPLEEPSTADEFHDPSENGGSDIEDVVDPAISLSRDILPTAPDVSSAVAQEDTPKKSYASIVKVMTGNVVSSTALLPTSKAKLVTVSNERKPVVPVCATPNETVVPDDNSTPESSNPPEEVEGYSVYIRNLPLNATPSQLEVEFKKFGLIKPGGVQVRNHKQNNYCFGFVEFDSLSSMQAAIEASPVIIMGRQAVVEEKRTTTRVGGSGSSGIPGGRGRFPPRGGFRNDTFRGRGGFGGGPSYGRNDFRNRGDFPSRGRGSTGRATESYQRVGRPSSTTPTPV